MNDQLHTSNLASIEARVKEIYGEHYRIARQELTEDAFRIADERVGKLEEKLMPKILNLENALNVFADPAFQFILRDAQLSAAATERDSDYELLSELLIRHVQKGEDRKIRAGIRQAVKIVDEIDNDALCGLTVAHAFEKFVPQPGTCAEGLKRLNDIFKSIMYRDLPTGFEWIDHLDSFKAVRIIPQLFGAKMQKVLDYYRNQVSGYLCVGINICSDDYKSALQLLESIGIGSNVLVPNECLNGYVRLPIANSKAIDDLYFEAETERVPLNFEQKQILRRIWGMYSQDSHFKKQVEDSFMKIYDSFDALRTFRLWWENIQQPFSITLIGRILAHTNAKRCDSTLPDLP